jgi:hypothetical protein
MVITKQDNFLQLSSQPKWTKVQNVSNWWWKIVHNSTGRKKISLLLHKQKFRWIYLSSFRYFFCFNEKKTISTFSPTFHIWFKFYVKSFSPTMCWWSLIHWTFPVGPSVAHLTKKFVMGRNFNWFISSRWQFSLFSWHRMNL